MCVCVTELNVPISSSSSIMSIPEVREEMADDGAFSRRSSSVLQVTMIADVCVCVCVTEVAEWQDDSVVYVTP